MVKNSTAGVNGTVQYSRGKRNGTVQQMLSGTEKYSRVLTVQKITARWGKLYGNGQHGVNGTA